MNAITQPGVSVIDAIYQRHSVRGFRPDPVPADTLQRVFEQAQQAPSNCNTQPWKVLVASGALRDSLRQGFLDRARAGLPQTPDFSYVGTFEGDYRTRQVACAVALYGEMGIERGDREGRLRAARRNFEFFDAPHVAFLCMDRSFGATIAVDVGIYVQTLMLAMQANGIGSCAMGSLRAYPDLVRDAFGVDDRLGVLFGLCFGYEDPGVAANRTRTDRESVSDAVVFRDR
ncbi:nitroreductase [Marinobacter sp. SS21]|uniref:nitroreductase n=1 Tax=Marinobacter sp. SS21 TaxID=2979460 RepID=UPI00232C98A1|nr:nitroreductase [Marinobacter sp. SS21]MDC0662981.1 nitroreductase [Marinobacter sp. SS21]